MPKVSFFINGEWALDGQDVIRRKGGISIKAKSCVGPHVDRTKWIVVTNLDLNPQDEAAWKDQFEKAHSKISAVDECKKST